jgi:hypothetical protein
VLILEKSEELKSSNYPVHYFKQLFTFNDSTIIPEQSQLTYCQNLLTFFLETLTKNMIQSMTQNINQKPTFDLLKWQILDMEISDGILFCQSTEVFKFDHCKGTILPRSRTLRLGKNESKWVKNIIAATIDAGFVGYLFWKIELTNYAILEIEKDLKILKDDEKFDFGKLQVIIQNSLQIDLYPFPTNYYDGTNQTELVPEIIFIS